MFSALVSIPGSAGAAEAPPAPIRPSVFIVTCRCPSSADRERIAGAVRRRGGSIVYMYEAMPGLAVASPRGSDATRFMARLRRIVGVTDVRVSEARQLQSTGG